MRFLDPVRIIPRGASVAYKEFDERKNSRLYTRRCSHSLNPPRGSAGAEESPADRVSIAGRPYYRIHSFRASSDGSTIQTWEVRTADAFEKIFTALNKERPDGLFVLGGSLMFAHQKRTIGFALKSRLPSMYVRREDVDGGGFMYYGADVADSYRRAASYVDKILKGAKPADLPVERPKKFEFIINLKTAKQIGLIIPANILARADRVIK